LASHAGRPGGTVHEELRMTPMARRLEALLGSKKKIIVASDCVGGEAERAVAGAGEGDIIMLENLRFHVGEEANDAAFARALAKGKDLFVNDQLGTSHRAHASVSAITGLLPSYAGILLIDEVEHLSDVLDAPPHPFVFIMAGAKLETKLPLVKSMLPRVDSIYIGGAAANTLLSYMGKPVGKSKVSLGHEAVVREPGWEKVKLPIDAVVAKDASGTGVRTCKVEDVRPDEYIYDVGPRTVEMIAKDAEAAQLIVWNGPLGYFEVPLFAKNSEALARKLAALGGNARQIVIGGGDTEDLVESAGVREKMSFVSTGGGAMLAFLSGEQLPGLMPLIIS